MCVGGGDEKEGCVTSRKSERGGCVHINGRMMCVSWEGMCVPWESEGGRGCVCVCDVLRIPNLCV